MDPDESGVFDAIDVDNHEVPRSEQEASENKQDPTPAEEVAPTAGETPQEEPAPQENDQKAEVPSQDKKEEPADEKSEVTPESSEVDDNWKQNLPPPPPAYNGPAPEVDENGQITNMNPTQYEDYILAKAEANLQKKLHTNYVENAALDAAERFLPEIKTNPDVRRMVENLRVAAVVNGENIDTVEAAKQVRNLIGGAKSEGAQNAKHSITIQKNAALETGGGQKQATPDAEEALQDRLDSGDDEAFVELLDIWEKEGKV